MNAQANVLPMPQWVLTPEALENPLVTGEYRALKPIRWLRANQLALHMHGAYDHRATTFPCLVQFRVNALDTLSFNGIELTDLLLTMETKEQSRNALEAIRSRAGTVEPDNQRPLSDVIQIEAIYHHAFVALPYQWRVGRGEVLVNHYLYEQLLEQIPVRTIRQQRATLAPLNALESPRIRYYANPTHAVYEVNGDAFWCEAWRREAEPTAQEWSNWACERECLGFNDRVEPYAYPKDVRQVQSRKEGYSEEDTKGMKLDRAQLQRLNVELDALHLIPLAKPTRPSK